MSNFDPNAIGVPNGNFLGLPYTTENADIVIIPVPWDVTTSYKPGTSKGPEAIIAASTQVDLYDYFMPNAWENKIATFKIPDEIIHLNQKLRPVAEEIIHRLEEGFQEDHPEILTLLKMVNEGSEYVNNWVRNTARNIIDQGRIPCVLGGDHSSPFGLIWALSEKYPELGILHIDAHADLRNAYEGFLYSHASIMYNTITQINPDKLIQVAIRDVCQQEIDFANSSSKIKQFDDYSMNFRKLSGEPFADICEEIVSSLPEKVYISFDIDGLSPDLCPYTGTPVPGGLTFGEAILLIHMLSTSGRKIVGFDLCEVAPGNDTDWDANVGARILQKLCNLTTLSQAYHK